MGPLAPGILSRPLVGTGQAAHRDRIISTLLILSILRVPFLVALIAGASIAPTDPILAEAIVQGSVARQSIPERMRNAVTAESGANDGLGFPFVWLGLALATRPAGPALAYWALRIVLWAVVGGSALGVAFGLGACSGCPRGNWPIG